MVDSICLSNRDLYAVWLSKNCSSAPGKSVPVAAAFDDWAKFALGNGELTPGSRQAFGRAMARNRLQASAKRAGVITFKVYNNLRILNAQVAHV